MYKAVNAFVSFNKLVIQFIGTVLPARLCLEIPLNRIQPVAGVSPDFNDVELEVTDQVVVCGRVGYPVANLVYGLGPLLPETFDIPAQGAVA